MTESPIDKYLRTGSVEQSLMQLAQQRRDSVTLDKAAFRALIAKVPELEIDRIDVTRGVRPGRADEKWLNAWCVRA